MCGRYTLESDMEFLQQRFKFGISDLGYKPRYNIAPTQNVLTVTNNGETHGQFMRWGLVPFWVKDLKIGSRMINAKSETLAEKASFRNAFKNRRCLVLADGFFEWRKEGKEKIPTYIFLKSRKSPENEAIKSCTMVTTEPNPFMESIHSRMSVMLSKEAEALWLDPLTEDPGVLKAVGLLPGLYHGDPPKNEGRENIEPLVA